MDPTILPELGSDAPPSQPDAPGSNPQAPRSPSPFPDRSGSRAAYDETFSQTRVSVLFTSKPVLVSPFPISVTLTLLAAPVTRISSVTFRASFPDGSILSLTPVAITSDKTDVHHVDGKTHEIDLSVGTPRCVFSMLFRPYRFHVFASALHLRRGLPPGRTLVTSRRTTSARPGAALRVQVLVQPPLPGYSRKILAKLVAMVYLS
jgi:hypothetical protein